MLVGFSGLGISCLNSLYNTHFNIKFQFFARRCDLWGIFWGRIWRRTFGRSGWIWNCHLSRTCRRQLLEQMRRGYQRWGWVAHGLNPTWFEMLGAQVGPLKNLYNIMIKSRIIKTIRNLLYIWEKTRESEGNWSLFHCKIKKFCESNPHSANSEFLICMALTF